MSSGAAASSRAGGGSAADVPLARRGERGVGRRAACPRRIGDEPDPPPLAERKASRVGSRAAGAPIRAITLRARATGPSPPGRSRPSVRARTARAGRIGRPDQRGDGERARRAQRRRGVHPHVRAWASGCEREGRLDRESRGEVPIFTPGPAGFGSAWVTRARLARYGPAAALETLKAMRSPGAAESRVAIAGERDHLREETARTPRARPGW